MPEWYRLSSFPISSIAEELFYIYLFSLCRNRMRRAKSNIYQEKQRKKHYCWVIILQILLIVCAVTSALMLKPPWSRCYNARMWEYVVCEYRTYNMHYYIASKKNIIPNILSKNTINRINFHQDLWMLCGVFLSLRKKTEKLKKKELKIDSLNWATATTTNNIQSNIVNVFTFNRFDTYIHTQYLLGWSKESKTNIFERFSFIFCISCSLKIGLPYYLFE